MTPPDPATMFALTAWFFGATGLAATIYIIRSLRDLYHWVIVTLWVRTVRAQLSETENRKETD